MRLIKRVTAGADLSDELRTLLRDGPWAVGLDLRTMPPHEELEALWAKYGTEITASLPVDRRGRRKTPWFADRAAFVAALRAPR